MEISIQQSINAQLVDPTMSLCHVAYQVQKRHKRLVEVLADKEELAKITIEDMSLEDQVIKAKDIAREISYLNEWLVYVESCYDDCLFIS